MFALSWLGLFLAQCPGSGEDPTGAATVFSFGGLFVHHYYSHLMELVPTAVRGLVEGFHGSSRRDTIVEAVCSTQAAAILSVWLLDTIFSAMTWAKRLCRRGRHPHQRTTPSVRPDLSNDADVLRSKAAAIAEAVCTRSVNVLRELQGELAANFVVEAAVQPAQLGKPSPPHDSDAMTHTVVIKASKPATDEGNGLGDADSVHSAPIGGTTDGEPHCDEQNSSVSTEELALLRQLASGARGAAGVSARTCTTAVVIAVSLAGAYKIGQLMFAADSVLHGPEFADSNAACWCTIITAFGASLYVKWRPLRREWSHYGIVGTPWCFRP